MIIKDALVVLALLATAVATAQINLQHSEEWLQWKSQHGKNYDSQRHELERHLVWLSNREYINAHNKNADIFGFTLAMNHFGDMVRKTSGVIFVIILWFIYARLTRNIRKCT